MKLEEFVIHSRVILVVLCVLFPAFLSGCVDEESSSPVDTVMQSPPIDQPSMLPEWEDGEYHDYQATTILLQTFETSYPYLTEVFSIGTSTCGRDIWCIKLTNENSTHAKLSCLIDGCIHGNEWEGAEACLYLAEYLLFNYPTNYSITTILNTTEIYIVPFVNPDGRAINERYTDNGVDANRNFDIFFGRFFRGQSYRLGKLLGRFKIPALRIPPDDPFKWYWNCGKYPFSEPETKALSDFMKTLENKGFSFYVNCHTPTTNIITPWLSYKPPFKMTQVEKQVFEHIVDWIETHTIYEGDIGQTLHARTGGNAMDWCFQEFRIPSFTFEIYTWDYGPYREDIHVDLIYWMQTTLPFFMYLLVNIEALQSWEIPHIEPQLPEEISSDVYN